MEREELIKKWLDNELNSHELEAFKKLEDYDDLIKLSNSLMQFKAPEYDSTQELHDVWHAIKSSKSTVSKKTHWMRPFMRIAAVLALALSVYYYTTTLDTSINTLAAQKTSIELPDASQVSLNAASSITFNKHDWKKERNVTLNGEAFFKVAKGSTFNVTTSTGTVTVLGTEFNVKQRDNYFEVTCYEGSVKVTHNSNIVILKPGHSFLNIDGKLIATEKETSINPSWINNESYFKSMPFAYVIREFERQYNVTITPHNINLNELFTGSFSHNNKELAIKTITLPLNIEYSFKDSTTIELSRD